MKVVNDRILELAGMNEGLNLDIEKGDTILVGRFKNKPIEVKEFGTDAKGQPTINGRTVLTFRIKKLIPEVADEDRMLKLAGIK